jgi:hypothetical protein
MPMAGSRGHSQRPSWLHGLVQGTLPGARSGARHLGGRVRLAVPLTIPNPDHKEEATT